MRGPVLLIGNMGAGKTTVGAALSRLSGWEVVDMDSLIAASCGKSISSIFSTEGEAAFREMEHALLASLIDREDLIVSCGGGIVEHPDSRALLSSCDTVVYLTADPAVLAGRIGDRGGRPLLASGARESVLRTLQCRREPLYRSVATLIIDTTNISPEAIANGIMEYVNNI